MLAGSSSGWPSGVNESVDCAKDVTLSKESGDDWDDDPLIDLRPDNEAATAAATAVKYNYCCVHKSAFPLGYERSMSTF